MVATMTLGFGSVKYIRQARDNTEINPDSTWLEFQRSGVAREPVYTAGEPPEFTVALQKGG